MWSKNLTKYEKGQKFISKILATFKAEGYDVFTTQHRAGPDIYAKKNGRLYLIEVKSIWSEEGRNIIFKRYQLPYLITLSTYLGATPLIVISHKKINDGELRVIDNAEIIADIVTHLNPANAKKHSVPLAKWFNT